MKSIVIAFIISGILSTYTASATESLPTQETMEANAFQAYQEKSKFNREKMGKRLQRTLNTQIKFASHHLKRRGIQYGVTALKEWETKYKTVFLTTEIGALDLGDHEAISWLLDFYTKLEGFLGESTLKALHLDDIKTLAYAIPVVFEPARSDIDKPEYKLHFVPFGKAVGYWGVYAGCSIYNWVGMPAVNLVCTPISEAGRIVFGIIADPLSDAIWESSN